METDWGSIFGSHYKYQQVLTCFLSFFSSFLHEEAALFYICFDVVIVVNTKYIFKLNTPQETTRPDILWVWVSLLYEVNSSPCFSLHNAFFLVVKCIECTPSLLLGYWVRARMGTLRWCWWSMPWKWCIRQWNSLLSRALWEINPMNLIWQRMAYGFVKACWQPPVKSKICFCTLSFWRWEVGRMRWSLKWNVTQNTWISSCFL